MLMRFRLLLVLAFSAVLLTGCRDVRAPDVVKIGLIAPFEGPSRALGYDVLAAVKLRIRQWNESDAVPKIELVALNDDGDPVLAARLPQQLAQDRDVRVILGPPQGHTAAAINTPELVRLGIPTLLLAPVAAPAGDTIIPYGGLYADYGALLGGEATMQTPLTHPAVWMGDPLTLATLLAESDSYLIGAGPVADEAAVQGWDKLATGWRWAAPQPQDAPEQFVAAYEQTTGKAPSAAAMLAWAATDAVLQRIARAYPQPIDINDLHSINFPPVRIQP